MLLRWMDARDNASWKVETMTEHDTETETRLRELRALLDVHGADERRWPEHMRRLARACGALADRDIIEAQALERVLSAAPSATAGADLRERVLAAARQKHNAPQRSLSAGGRSGRLPVSAARAVRYTPARARSGFLPAASLLAASLFIGVLIGASAEPAQVMGRFVYAFAVEAKVSDALGVLGVGDLELGGERL